MALCVSDFEYSEFSLSRSNEKDLFHLSKFLFDLIKNYNFFSGVAIYTP